MLLQDRARAEADATHRGARLMLLQHRARAEADATHGGTRLMLLQDRAKTEADVANGNTSDSCWSARELLEARERELQYPDDAQEGLGVWG
jgi:hypothetical protein